MNTTSMASLPVSKNFLQVIFLLLLSGICVQCSTSYQSRAVTIQAGLENDPQLSTFFSLVQTAGGMEALLKNSSRNHTFFVPSNNAFDQLGQKLLDNLSMEDNRDVLLGVLQSHVAADPIRAAAVTDKGDIPTSLFNTPIDLKANSAEILYSIKTRQGLIHVIDKVIQR